MENLGSTSYKSLSLSSGSSKGFDHASTSGYSSDATTEAKYTESKKKKKNAEMKLFIPPKHLCNDKISTPLQSCFKSPKSSEELLSETKDLFQTFSFKDLKRNVSVRKGLAFGLAISLKDGITLYATSSVTDILGYPKNMLVGECIMNLLYPQDRISFAGHLTEKLNSCYSGYDLEGNGVQKKNSSYCRIRHYLNGNNTDKSIMYKPFEITFSIKRLALENTTADNPLCIVAIAIPIESAYKVAEEKSRMAYFTTKHTASCYFSHMDTSAIPYLGYLPQDIIGHSVFDFYDIDYLSQLKDIYELVVKEHGLSFRSKPYRFRVFNGCFITVETEWSSFINPWSNKLEFVMGHHKILKGPLFPNVFGHCSSENRILNEELLEESKTIQEEIRLLLSQPMKKCEIKLRKRHVSKQRCGLLCSKKSILDSEKLQHDEYQDSHEGCTCSDQGSVVMGDISPHEEEFDCFDPLSKEPSLQEMQYQENIERFFASHPKTYSSTSRESKRIHKTGEGRSRTLEFTASSGNHMNNSDLSVHLTRHEKDVTSLSNISVCKRKVASVDSGNTASCKKKCRTCIQNTGCSHTQQFSLTMEMLSQHNRISNKHLKQNKTKIPSSNTHHAESNSISVNTISTQTENPDSPKNTHPCKHSPCFGLNFFANGGCSTPQCQHQSIPFGSSEDNLARNVCGSTFSSQIPSFIQHNHGCVSSCSNTSGSPNLCFIPVMCMGSVPVIPSIPSLTTESGSSVCPFNSATENIECHSIPDKKSWSKCSNIVSEHEEQNCSQKSIQVSTQNDTKGCRQKFPLLEKSQFRVHRKIPCSVFKHGRYFKKRDGQACAIHNESKTEQQSEESLEYGEKDSQEDTTLSFSSSFLKSDDGSRSCSPSDKIDDSVTDRKNVRKVTKAVRSKPPWMENVNMNNEVVFCYQLESQNMDDVLRKDLDVLKTVKQPDMVSEQMNILISELTTGNKSSNDSKSDLLSLGFATVEENASEELHKQEKKRLCQLSGDE